MNIDNMNLNWENQNVTDVLNHDYSDVMQQNQENTTQQLVIVPYHPLTSFIEQYTIPVISIFGLISNMLSSIVFLQKKLRDSSCSIFLAARGFVDNGFLSTLLIVWISQTFHLHLGSLSGSCKVVIFLSYICGFISVWLVVFITLENYIRICKPFVVKRFCTTTLAKLVVAVLCIISVCIYNFPFWAMSEGNCLYLPHHRYSVQALIYTDTVITLALPLCCIIYLMTAIVCTLLKSCRLRNQRHATRATTNNPLAKVTKMLFAVTIIFFCLNLPSHIYRYVKMISSFVHESTGPDRHSIKDEAIQLSTLLLSYISISTNIFVYVIFGSKFRAVLLNMCHLCESVTSQECINQAQRQDSVETKRNNNHTNNSNLQVNRSLTVLLTENEWSSELVPLQRSYTK